MSLQTPLQTWTGVVGNTSLGQAISLLSWVSQLLGSKELDDEAKLHLQEEHLGIIL